jgi:head-tail adaptor
MSVLSLCNKKVNVQRRAKTADGQGGFSEAWSALYTNMPCRIQPVTAEEAAIYGAEKVGTVFKMFVPPGYSFEEKDRVKDGTDYYDIQSVLDIDFMAHHLEVIIRRIKPAL